MSAKFIIRKQSWGPGERRYSGVICDLAGVTPQVYSSRNLAEADRVKLEDHSSSRFVVVPLKQKRVRILS